MKWMATVQRTCVQETTFEVEAETSEQADAAARDQAGDKDFSGTEKDADYDVVGLRPVLVCKEYEK